MTVAALISQERSNIQYLDMKTEMLVDYISYLKKKTFPSSLHEEEGEVKPVSGT